MSTGHVTQTPCKEANVLTQEELLHLLEYWTNRLRLGEWTISLTVAPLRDFVSKERLAEVEYDYYQARAVIRLLDPKDYPDDCLQPLDMEMSLVHELLHLRLAQVADEATPLVERTINMLAQALIEEKRKHE